LSTQIIETIIVKRHDCEMARRQIARLEALITEGEQSISDLVLALDSKECALCIVKGTCPFPLICEKTLSCTHPFEIPEQVWCPVYFHKNPPSMGCTLSAC